MPLNHNLSDVKRLEHEEQVSELSRLDVGEKLALLNKVTKKARELSKVENDLQNRSKELTLWQDKLAEKQNLLERIESELTSQQEDIHNLEVRQKELLEDSQMTFYDGLLHRVSRQEHQLRMPHPALQYRQKLIP